MKKNKKVAVITFFQSDDNYGQLLQCYALQRVLKNIGTTPFVIRYGFHKKYYHWFSTWNFTTKQGIRLFLKKILEIIKNRNIRNNRDFDGFRKKYIKQSFYCYNNLAELQGKPPKADVYITGSDQVWAQLLNNINNKSFFLDFGQSSVKRIAYAPSFAIKAYPIELKNDLKNNLRRFNAISVREKTGIIICKDVGADAKLVLDPTLLLTKLVYDRIAITTKYRRYAFVYHVNIEKSQEIFWKECKKFNEKSGLLSIATYANPIEGITMEMLFGANYLYPTIGEWIGLIKHAEYVLTSSFHGMVFSILYHKPFAVCLRKESTFAGNDRVTDLLDSLGLKDRIITNGDQLNNILCKYINWEKIEEKLQKYRENSIDFLKYSVL